MEYPDGLSREQWLEQSEKGMDSHPFFKYPDNPDQKIWRYMDFAKFVALIDSSALFFPSATNLNDPFEGAVSKENLRLRPIQIEGNVMQLINESPDSPLSPDHENKLRNMLNEHSLVRAEHQDWQRYWTYISCWHMNDHESAAMWKLYAVSNQAIAIQSTFRNLRQCLQPHKNPPMAEPIPGKVHYADYETEEISRKYYLSEFFYKRKSFAHEAELRAVMQELPKVPASYDSEGNVTAWHHDIEKPPIPGKFLAIDLNLLIEAVYIAPSAPIWLTALTKSIMAKYGLNKNVHNSGLDESPVY